MLQFGKRKDAGLRRKMIGAMAVALVGVLSAGPAFAQEKIKIAATIGMVADLVRQVGGDRVEVEQLMGPGVDPHLYKPTSADAGRLSKADVIFYSGLMLEGRMGDLFAKLARSGKRVYPTTESVPEDLLTEPKEFAGHYDPHIWFDVSMWAQTIPTIVKGLGEADPAGKEIYDLGRGDVILLGVVTALALGAVTVLYKEYLMTSFDAGFARSLGMPVQVFHYSLMLLLAFAIVSSLQAVGVVLVSAMLVIPAAAAFLLTDRLGMMLILSAIFGMVSGGAGAFFSFVGRNLPTGPFMVLAAGAVFTAALFFGPRHGIFSRLWRQHSRSARIFRENTLKAIYHVLEDQEFAIEQVSIRELAERRRETLEEARHQLGTLRRHRYVTLSSDGDSASLTPEGWRRACEIVRNHRLWELYLTNAAHLPPDHVHEDAEKIEHLLGEETVRMLEKRLNYANRDPHGRLIPGLEDMRSATAMHARQPRATGFGNAAKH